MKQLLVFILALGLFTACKDKKGPDPRNKGDYYKDDYRNGDDRNNNGDDENRNSRNNRNDDENMNNNDRNNNNDEPVDDNSNGSAGSWGSANEDVFVSNCVSSAASSGKFTKSQAKAYCTCMLEKLETRYPNPEQISGMDENDPTMLRMAKECVGELE